MASWNFIFLYTGLLFIGVHSQDSTSVTTSGPTTEATNETNTPDETTTTTDIPITGTEGSPTTSRETTVPDTTIATTAPPIKCFDGNCSGNITDDTDVSCINDSLSTFCTLKNDETCFQTVFKNNTDVIIHVGCKSNCEYLVEEGQGTDSVSTTRCCDTDMCNGVLLPDPGSENSAVSMTSYISTVVCFVVYMIM